MFVAGCVTDVIFALYLRSVANDKFMRGAIFSVCSGLCSIVFVDGIVTHPWTAVFWLFGLFVGTLYSRVVETALINFMIWANFLHGDTYDK